MKSRIFLLSLLLLVCLVAPFLIRAQTQTVPNYARMLSGVNPQTGTTYAFVPADATRLTTFANTSAVAATLLPGNNVGFGAGTLFSVQNLGSGNLTITCSSCLIFSSGSVGSATLVLTAGQGADIYGSGLNYSAFLGGSGGGGSGNVIAAGNNAFTGNNSHAGTENFAGNVTLDNVLFLNTANLTTAGVQAAMNSICTGGTNVGVIVLPPPATGFLATGFTGVTVPSNCAIKGPSKLLLTLQASASYTGDLFLISGAQNVTLQDFGIDGNRTVNTTSGNLIHVTNSTKVTLQNLNISNAYGNGIFLDSAVTYADILNNDFYGIGPFLPGYGGVLPTGPGAAINNGGSGLGNSHVKIQGNKISNSSIPIYIQPSTNTANVTQDFDISHNLVWSNAWVGLTAFSANQSGGPMRDFKIIGNQVWCSGYPANGTGWSSLCSAAPGLLQTGVASSPDGVGIEYNSPLLEGGIIADNISHDNFYEGIDVSSQTASTVNTSGTAVSWVSGDVFNLNWKTNQTIRINGSQYILASAPSSTTSLTLTATAGTQTGVGLTGSGQNSKTTVTGNIFYNNGKGNGNTSGSGGADVFGFMDTWSNNVSYNNNSNGFRDQNSTLTSHTNEIARANNSNVSPAFISAILCQGCLSPTWTNIKFDDLSTGNQTLGGQFDSQTSSGYASGFSTTTAGFTPFINSGTNDTVLTSDNNGLNVNNATCTGTCTGFGAGIPLGTLLGQVPAMNNSIAAYGPPNVFYPLASATQAQLQTLFSTMVTGSVVVLNNPITACGLTISTNGVSVSGANREGVPILCASPNLPVLSIAAGALGVSVSNLLLEHITTLPTCTGGTGTSTCGEGLQIGAGTSRTLVDNVHSLYNYHNLSLGWTTLGDIDNSFFEHAVVDDVHFQMTASGPTASHPFMQWNFRGDYLGQAGNDEMNMVCPNDASFDNLVITGPPFIGNGMNVFGSHAIGFDFSCSLPPAHHSGIGDVWFDGGNVSTTFGDGMYLDMGNDSGRNVKLHAWYVEESGQFIGGAAMASPPTWGWGTGPGTGNTTTPTGNAYGINITSNCDVNAGGAGSSPNLTGVNVYQNGKSGVYVACNSTVIHSLSATANGQASISAQTEAGVTINANMVKVDGISTKGATQNYGTYHLGGDTPSNTMECDPSISAANCHFTGSWPTNGYQEWAGAVKHVSGTGVPGTSCSNGWRYDRADSGIFPTSYSCYNSLYTQIATIATTNAFTGLNTFPSIGASLNNWTFIDQVKNLTIQSTAALLEGEASGNTGLRSAFIISNAPEVLTTDWSPVNWSMEAQLGMGPINATTCTTEVPPNCYRTQVTQILGANSTIRGYGPLGNGGNMSGGTLLEPDPTTYPSPVGIPTEALPVCSGTGGPAGATYLFSVAMAVNLETDTTHKTPMPAPSAYVKKSVTCTTGQSVVTFAAPTGAAAGSNTVSAYYIGYDNLGNGDYYVQQTGGVGGVAACTSSCPTSCATNSTIDPANACQISGTAVVTLANLQLYGTTWPLPANDLTQEPVDLTNVTLVLSGGYSAAVAFDMQIRDMAIANPNAAAGKQPNVLVWCYDCQEGSGFNNGQESLYGNVGGYTGIAGTFFYSGCLSTNSQMEQVQLSGGTTGSATFSDFIIDGRPCNGGAGGASGGLRTIHNITATARTASETAATPGIIQGSRAFTNITDSHFEAQNGHDDVYITNGAYVSCHKCEGSTTTTAGAVLHYSSTAAGGFASEVCPEGVQGPTIQRCSTTYPAILDDTTSQTYIGLTPLWASTGYARFFQTAAMPYATLNTLLPCTSVSEGAMGAVTNDTTAIAFNATIAGGGSFHVHAYCNGTNWVMQ